MKLSEIYKLADEIAPKALSDEYCRVYGAYDNSGLLVEAGEEIQGILFSLDLTNAAIDEAIEKGCNLIITHHPAIYGKIGNVCQNDDKLLGGKLVKCIQNGISVICMHLNLDVVNGGIDESLQEGVLLSSGNSEGRSAELMHALSQGGYGRVYALNEISLNALVENMKQVFTTERILSYGNGEKTLRKAASFCGAGVDDASVAFAKRSGVDVVISADFKHHHVQFLVESGISVIVLTHYASEQYGFRKYYKKICQAVEIPCVYHTDNELF